jgi:DNA-binding MltR family transcriptional regulator
MTWFAPLLREFQTTSHRSFAIVAASMLDELLRKLISAHLVPPSAGETLLDGPHAPLGSFSSRIDAAYRLGFISSRLARDLHLVRKIRNEFAHTFEDIGFDTAAIEQRVKELAESNKISQRNPSIDPSLASSTAGQFLIGTSWIASFLTAYLEDDVEPFREAEIEWGYTTTIFER